MRLRRQFDLPGERAAMLRRAVVYEWVTIFFLITIAVVMYLTMGGSQAMKTAWIEDVLSLIPPISFLIAVRVRTRAPNKKHPYGYRRIVALSFLVASAAVVTVGLYIFYDAARALATRHHPTIGHFDLFGWHLWAGWVMIAALAYSMIPPVVLGRMKLPLATELHEKTLYADAAMNKADWMTAGAAILGILGIGMGLWWADAVAAAVISFEVLRDGVKNTKHAISDLMDQRPTQVENDKPMGVAEVIESYLASREDVDRFEVRLREEGATVAGELFVMPRGVLTPATAEEIARQAERLHWQIHELVVVPVASLDG